MYSQYVPQTELVGHYSRDQLKGKSRHEVMWMLSKYIDSLPFQDKHRLGNDVSCLMYDLGNSFSVSIRSTPSNPQDRCCVELDGLLPIVFKGNTYRTPITVTLSSHYPSNPPRIVVNASANMIVNSSCPFVHEGGAVRHEYLDRWQASSSLSEMMTLLASAFGAYPPLATVKAKSGMSSLASSASSMASSAYQRVADTFKTQSNPSPSPTAAPPAYAYGHSTQPRSPAPPTPPAYGAAPAPAGAAGALWPGTELTEAQRRRCLEDMVRVKLGAAHKAAFSDHSTQAAALHQERVAAAAALAAAEKAHEELHRADREGKAALEHVRAERELLARWVEVHGAAVSCAGAADQRSEQVMALVAEDRAVEAAIECLRDLLRQRRLGADAYMAQVRSLSARQYEARALAMQLAR